MIMTPRRVLGLLGLLGLLLACVLPRPATAHGLSPGVLTLIEQAPGVFAVVVTEPVDTTEVLPPLELGFPEPCRREAARLECGPAGLHGAITLRTPGPSPVRVMTLVRFLDGRTVEAMLTPEAPTLVVDQPPGRSGVAWLSLGVEHILRGYDHLAFVLGLLLVVGTHRWRRLLATITAFTVAHSLTLALAATGVLTLATAPVEATIAASVVLVAREATHERPTLTRRAPWLVALGFGLVHGLGFAGALVAWGLPAGWVGRSLLWFNLGVELGQLAIIAAVVVVVRLLGRRLAPLRPWLVYAIGGLAAFWLIARTLAIVGVGVIVGS